jgi:hypothetical protein
MGFVVVLLTIVCYGLALFLWWSQQKPVFFLALLAGHVGALASPFWPLLYATSYRADMSVFLHMMDQPLPWLLFVASAWFYTLPALLVLYLYILQWWVAGYFTGLVTYGVFLFYHTVLESIGLRVGLWSYTNAIALPLGVSNALVSTLMAALISLIFLYVLLLTRRFSLISMLLVLVPSVLLITVLVRGVLGAPLWVALTLQDWQERLASQDWVVTLGALGTIVLLAWAVHIVARGLSRVEWDVT